jgi:hypothetical protein
MVLQIGYVGSQGRHLELVMEGNPISPAGTAACAAYPTCVSQRVFQSVEYPTHSLYASGNIFASGGLAGQRGCFQLQFTASAAEKELDGWPDVPGQLYWSLSLGDSSDLSLQCPGAGVAYYGCWDAPNTVGYPSNYNPRNTTLNFGSNPALPNYYFNPNAFSDETPGMLGNEGKGNFHGPGINNTDLALIKSVKLGESRSVQLRLEAFNVFNHTQFLFSGNIPAFQDLNAPSTFGRVTTAYQGRVVQLGAKIYF